MAQTYLYQDYIDGLSKRFLSKLDFMSAVYNFDIGDEFEFAICEILRDFLPSKYGVCRGFVVSANGECIGDDIIIYDQDRFPTLRLLERNRFDKKEKIPIEAIYAYIEAKHNLDATTLEKAFAQVCGVKELCGSREKVELYQHDPYIQASLRPPYPLTHLPEIRNPVFAMIIGRYSVGPDGRTKATSPEDVENFLRARLNTLSLRNYMPDLIIAGKDNFLAPANVQNGQNKPTLHYLPGSTEGYQVIQRPGIAFGVALAHLAAAIDFARLGKMPWERILNDARFPESKET